MNTKTSAVTTFGFFCRCGAGMSGEVEPAENAAQLERLFRAVHQGDGHAPVERATATRARRREERRQQGEEQA